MYLKDNISWTKDRRIFAFYLSMLKTITCFPIYFYIYVISPWLRPCCRFYPSCSRYALLAIHHYGIFKGGSMALWRIVRCHPWAHGGYDPILPNQENI